MSTPSELSSRREMQFREERGGFTLTLKRNCSISPAGLARVYAALAAVVLGIAALLAAAGAPLVLPFAGLEVLGLGIAFLAYARHAADYERIELAGDKLTVEVGEALRTARFELEASGTRVCVRKQAGGGATVLLCAGERELEIGRHLDAAAREQFGLELKRRLRN